MAENSPIVIVGGGPVGLTAALGLARRGLAVEVLEQDTDFCQGSRAICISRRSLQILDRLGAGQAFIDKGLSWSEGTSYYGDREVFHLQMPMGADDRFPPFINLQQYYAERFLYDALQAYPHAVVRWGTTVTDMETQGARVRVHCQDDSGAHEIEAPWVIAADGAKSTVRRQFGLKMTGEAYDKNYLIADIEIDLPWPAARKVWFDPPSNPDSTVIMHRQPDNVWRIDYQLLAGMDAEAAPAEDRVRARIQQHLETIGFGDRSWQLLWRSLYRAHCLSLPDYRHGRILFAGDAAHLVPIFGVRGLNSGIDDADNLAWKLAAVQQGAAGAALLDSYTTERHGAYQDNIENARKSTWFMSPPSDGFEIARQAVLELATVEPGLRGLINPRQSSAHCYDSAAVIDAPGDAQTTPGWPVPDIKMGDGRDLHALFGRDFTALYIAGGAAAVHQRDDTLPGGVGLRLITVPEADPAVARLGGAAGSLLLIRPDDHIALRRAGIGAAEAGTIAASAAISVLQQPADQEARRYA